MPHGDRALFNNVQQVATSSGQAFTADTTASHIRFTGNGVGKNHSGSFHLSSGTITVMNHQVTGGLFVININSLDLEEKAERIQTKLKEHLLSPDFFDAEKFSTAKFQITQVVPYLADSSAPSIVEGANSLVSGNFTLKEVTRNITFPAKIDVSGKMLGAKANFDIDRTQWRMNYGSDRSLKDKFISETVNIELDLQAKL